MVGARLHRLAEWRDGRDRRRDRRDGLSSQRRRAAPFSHRRDDADGFLHPWRHEWPSVADGHPHVFLRQPRHGGGVLRLAGARSALVGQMTTHMYFFASLAMVVAFCDWRPIIAGTVTIALHHLILNFVLPSLVFTGGGTIGRVILHAVIVLIEAAVLIWVARFLTKALTEAEQSLVAANDATESARAAGQHEQEAQARAKDERDTMRRTIAGDFERAVGALVDDVTAKSEQAAKLAETMTRHTHQSASSADDAAKA